MQKKGGIYLIAGLLFGAWFIFAAYHHQSERDSLNFLKVHPDKVGGKLDLCGLCHSGGLLEKSGALDQAEPWPYQKDWDHNAGSSTRSVTMIRVEPLPPGTTDIDIAEVGWKYIDEGKIVIYGAIAPVKTEVKGASQTQH